MKAKYYPIAVICLALGASQAKAMCIEGIARCATQEACEAPADSAALAGEHATDFTPAALGEARAPGGPASVAEVAAPVALERIMQAIQSAVVIPLRYGYALISGGAEAPKPKKKPRTLTLF